jgi:hypothetical protein
MSSVSFEAADIWFIDGMDPEMVPGCDFYCEMGRPEPNDFICIVIAEELVVILLVGYCWASA